MIRRSAALLLPLALGRRARPRAMLIALAALVAGFGCASHPLPLGAQPGSTIAIPLEERIVFTGETKIGYGSQWFENRNRFDDQRGELVAVFSRVGFPADVFEEQPLIMLRLHPAPTSNAALKNKIRYQFGGNLDTADFGQPVAIVNVPIAADCKPGPYDITFKRRIRIDDTQWDDTLAPPNYTGQIDVLDTCGDLGDPNDPETLSFGLESIAWEMKQLYPWPYALLLLPDGDTYEAAAAGRLVVNYLPSKVKIHGAIEAFHTGRKSIVQWQDDAAGTLTIDFVNPDLQDPDGFIAGIGVAFEQLIDYQAGKSSISEFTLDLPSSRLYDIDGSLIHDDGSGGLLPGIVVPSQIR